MLCDDNAPISYDMQRPGEISFYEERHEGNVTKSLALGEASGRLQSADENSVTDWPSSSMSQREGSNHASQQQQRQQFPFSASDNPDEPALDHSRQSNSPLDEIERHRRVYPHERGWVATPTTSATFINSDKSVGFLEHVFPPGTEPHIQGDLPTDYRLPSQGWTEGASFPQDSAFHPHASAPHMSADLVEVPLMQQHHALLRRMHHEQALASLPAAAFRTFDPVTTTSSAPSRQHRQRRLERLEQMYPWKISTRTDDSSSIASESRKNSIGSVGGEQPASPSSAGGRGHATVSPSGYPTGLSPLALSSVSSPILLSTTSARVNVEDDPSYKPYANQTMRSLSDQEATSGREGRKRRNKAKDDETQQLPLAGGMVVPAPLPLTILPQRSVVDEEMDTSLDRETEAEDASLPCDDGDGDGGTETGSSIKSRASRTRPRKASSASIDSAQADHINAARAASARQRRSEATEVSKDLALLLREPDDGCRLSRTALLSRALRRITEAQNREVELEARLHEAREHIRRLGGSID